jgi:hypothetical protein
MTDVEINAIEDEDFASLRAAATYGPSAYVAFPVTLKQKQEDKNGECIKRSLQSLRAAGDTLSSLTEMNAEDNDHEELSMLLLSAMVLNCLFVVCLELDLCYQAEEAQRLVSILCSEVDEDWLKLAG